MDHLPDRYHDDIHGVSAAAQRDHDTSHDVPGSTPERATAGPGSAAAAVHRRINHSMMSQGVPHRRENQSVLESMASTASDQRASHRLSTTSVDRTGMRVRYVIGQVRLYKRKKRNCVTTNIAHAEIHSNLNYYKLCVKVTH
jgi:hypothetical protein